LAPRKPTTTRSPARDRAEKSPTHIEGGSPLPYLTRTMSEPAGRKKEKLLKKKALVQKKSADPEQRVVAITGAYSFLGAELIKGLGRDRRYYKVLAIDVRKPSFPLHKTQFHKVDLTLPTADADLAAILSREGVDTFVHTAFLSAPTHETAWAHELE